VWHALFNIFNDSDKHTTADLYNIIMLLVDRGCVPPKVENSATPATKEFQANHETAESDSSAITVVFE